MRGQPNVSSEATWCVLSWLAKSKWSSKCTKLNKVSGRVSQKKRVPIWASWDWFAYFDIHLNPWELEFLGRFSFSVPERTKTGRAKCEAHQKCFFAWHMIYIRKLFEDLESLFVNLLCFFNFTKKQFQLSAKVSRTCCFSTVSCLKHNTSRTACS